MVAVLYKPELVEDAVEVTTVAVTAISIDKDGDLVWQKAQVAVPLVNADMRNCNESLQIQIEDLSLVPSEWEIVSVSVIDDSEDEF